MKEIYTLLIGFAVILLGFPIGNLLARYTKEELAKGQIWFILLIFLGFVGSILGLIFANDGVLFFCLFVIVVTSRSLSKKN